MKYIFLRLRDRIGETEFSNESVHELPDDADIHEYARQRAQESWTEDEQDEDSGEWKKVPSETREGMDPDVYFSPSMEIATKVTSVYEIPKEHYDILKQYI